VVFLGIFIGVDVATEVSRKKKQGLSRHCYRYEEENINRLE
jgi:hypothetical protein